VHLYPQASRWRCSDHKQSLGRPPILRIITEHTRRTPPSITNTITIGITGTILTCIESTGDPVRFMAIASASRHIPAIHFTAMIISTAAAAIICITEISAAVRNR
jgi:hypothetical protein